MRVFSVHRDFSPGRKIPVDTKCVDARWGLTIGAGKHETGDPDTAAQDELLHKKAHEFL